MAAREVKVIESSRELTARERIKAKDITEAVKIDEVTKVEPLKLKVKEWVVLEVSTDTETYKQYVLTSVDDTKYVVSSDVFWNAYMDIYSEMIAENDVDFEIKIYRRPSAKYPGRDFITCSLV